MHIGQRSRHHRDISSLIIYHMCCIIISNIMQIIKLMDNTQAPYQMIIGTLHNRDIHIDMCSGGSKFTFKNPISMHSRGNLAKCIFFMGDGKLA
ncbi:hypothetical protein D3C87_1497830 [compost metagenome]